MRTLQSTALMLKFASLMEMFDGNWEAAVDLVNEMLPLVTGLRGLLQEHLYVVSAQECCNRRLNRLKEADQARLVKEEILRTTTFQENDAIAAVLSNFNSL